MANIDFYRNYLFEPFLIYTSEGKKREENTVVINKIESFANLGEGWNYGKGKAPSNDMIAFALQVHNWGKSIGFGTDANPDPSGSIILTFFINDDFIFVTIKENDLFDLVHEKGIGVEYEIFKHKEDVDLDYISKYLNTTKTKWFLSGLYTSKDIVRQVADFPVSSLKTTVEVSQYSKKLVPEQPVTAQYVRI